MKRKTDGDPLGGIDPINRLNTEDSVLYTWFPYALRVKMYVLPADRFVRVYVGPFDVYKFEMFVFEIEYPAVPCTTVKHMSVSGTKKGVVPTNVLNVAVAVPFPALTKDVPKFEIPGGPGTPGYASTGRLDTLCIPLLNPVTLNEYA